jgi:hypothetical protein
MSFDCFLDKEMLNECSITFNSLILIHKLLNILRQLKIFLLLFMGK